VPAPHPRQRVDHRHERRQDQRADEQPDGPGRNDLALHHELGRRHPGHPRPVVECRDRAQRRAAERLQPGLGDPRAGRRPALARRRQQDGRHAVVVHRPLLGEGGRRCEVDGLHERARGPRVAAQLGPQRLLHRPREAQRRHAQVVGPARHEGSTRLPRREVPEHDRPLRGLVAEDGGDIVRARRARRACRGDERERPPRAPWRAEDARQLEQRLGARQLGDRSGRRRVAVGDQDDAPVERPSALRDDRLQRALPIHRHGRARPRADVEAQRAQIVGHVDGQLLVARASRPAVGEVPGQLLEVLPRAVAVERDRGQRGAHGARLVPEREREHDERE
jgi:hypothetical protein